MSTPQDPYLNPPGWTDPYADLTSISGDDPLPPMEPPTTPPAQPPGSPLLTGLIIGLLLIALSVAIFQLLRSEDSGTAADTTTTTLDTATSITEPLSTTTTLEEAATATTVPITDPYLPVAPAISVEEMEMVTSGMRIDDDDIPNIVFGTDADIAIGRFVASFGDPTKDDGWRVSTGGFGVCIGDLERIVFFGTYAAVVTKPGGQELYTGYRQDLTFGDLTHPAAGVATLSGLRIGDTVGELRELYKSRVVSFSSDPKLGNVFRVEGEVSGDLLLWGPVEGEDDADRVIGIYAPDVCNR
ncbi:MAG: hypothetical protein QGD89_09295 [Actinomycetota bacterium]|nr:hypothetical protein [Actinomycetota bacterium]